MKYIDSNIFVFSATNDKEIGDKARKLLAEISTGDETYCTSVLTFDEVFWIVKKERGLNAAIVVGEQFFETNNLLLLDVTEKVGRKSLELIKVYNLDPRDAIHASSCIINGLKTIISDDADLDKVKELKREPIK